MKKIGINNDGIVGKYVGEMGCEYDEGKFNDEKEVLDE
jgi:hypothetical protein